MGGGGGKGGGEGEMIRCSCGWSHVFKDGSGVGGTLVLLDKSMLSRLVSEFGDCCRECVEDPVA